MRAVILEDKNAPTDDRILVLVSPRARASAITKLEAAGIECFELVHDADGHPTRATRRASAT